MLLCLLQNLKGLVSHVVDKFWERLAPFAEVETIKGLRLRYEQNQESNGEEATQHRVLGVEARRRRDERSLDKGAPPLPCC